MLIEMNPHAVTIQAALNAHKLAVALQKDDNRTPGEQAIRAIRVRDPAIERWVEGAVAVMDLEHERLRGDTRRSATMDRASEGIARAESYELGLWKGALTTLQRQADTPHGDMMVYCYIYGAAAIMAGLAPRPHNLRSV